MMKNQVLKRKKPKNEEINLTPVLEEDKSISFSFANNSFNNNNNNFNDINNKEKKNQIN